MVELDFTMIAIAAMVIVPSAMIARILMNKGETGVKYLRSQLKMQDELIAELESQCRKYKNKASNNERGPQIEGDLSELDTIIPNVVSEFGDYAPKWLRPLLKNPDAQKWILDYVGKNPDKASELFGKILKKKGQTKTGER